MSKHTPGPWEQSHRKGINGFYNTEVYDSKGETIATIAWYPVKMKDSTVTAREPNAQLIASAPELLGVCKYLVDGIKRYGKDPHQEELPEISEAIKAIAKAEGK